MECKYVQLECSEKMAIVPLSNRDEPIISTAPQPYRYTCADVRLEYECSENSKLQDVARGLNACVAVVCVNNN